MSAESKAPACEELAALLTGRWKRNLEWRRLGGTFGVVRSSNTFVSLSEYKSSVQEKGVSYLKWEFGQSADEFTFGYVMRLTARETDALVEWQYSGHTCSGTYQPATGVMVLNFFLDTSTVVITYRVVDANTIAVCIVEAVQGAEPFVQLGNMCRILDNN